MKETILNDNEFAIVLDNGATIIANINAVPNIIKMFNNLMEKKETVTETVDTPVNNSSVADVKPVNDYELGFPETNYIGTRSYDNRNACLKAFAAGQGKLVISSEGKVFLSLAAAEEYYGLSIGFMSNYIRTHKGSGVDCGFNQMHSNIFNARHLFEIFRMFKDGQLIDNPTMNPFANPWYLEHPTDIDAKYCCFSFVLKGKNGPMHGPWQTERSCKDSGKDIAFIVFDNKKILHDTNPFEAYTSTRSFLACSAALKVFTYCLPNLSWKTLYKGMDKQLKVGEQIEKFFNSPVALQESHKQKCFNEIISYLKNKYNV